jgi:hypothetical protein
MTRFESRQGELIGTPAGPAGAGVTVGAPGRQLAPTRNQTSDGGLLKLARPGTQARS